MMDARRTLASATRTLSSSNFRDRLSSLSATPVAALHSRVECVPAAAAPAAREPRSPPLPQLRARPCAQETPPADARRRRLVHVVRARDRRLAAALVRVPAPLPAAPAHLRGRSCPPLWPLLAAYGLWIWLDASPEHGGRTSPWFRAGRFWRYFAEYYPASYVPCVPCVRGDGVSQAAAAAS